MTKTRNRTIWLMAVALIFAVGLFIQGCSGGGGGSVSDVLSSGSTSGSTTATTGTSGGFVSETPEERTAFTATQISGSAAIEGDASPVTTFDDGTSAAAATYLDMATCQGCHAETYNKFIQTNHSTAWTRKAVTTYSNYNNKSIFGFYKDTYGTKYCVNCHTVNGAFVDANSNHAYDAGELTPFGMANVAYDSYTDVAAEFQGIQCENCHGPASLHAAGQTAKIVGGIKAGRASTCQFCHGQYDEWTKSGHSIAASLDSTVNASLHAYERVEANGGCGGCHSGDGFVKALRDNLEPVDFCATGNQGANRATDCVAKNDATGAGVGHRTVTCTTCHDPHGTGVGEGQLRVARNQLCGKCHNSRYRKYVSGGVTRYDYIPGSSRTSHNPQNEMVLGGSGGQGAVQVTTGTGAAYTYGFSGVTATMTFTTKYAFITDTGPSMGTTSCPDCHMYSYTNRAAGIEWTGHTFFPQSEACQKCHSGMDVPTTINAIQGRFVTKYNALKARLDSFKAANNGIANCSVITTEGTTREICALAEYNINFMANDKSEGVHNEKYINKIYQVTDGLLKQLGY